MNFKIKNQIIQRIGEDTPANHSQEYLELSFQFLTTDWNGLTTFALFTDDKGLKYRVALTNKKVIVPNACLSSDKFWFSVYGVNDDLRITTNQILIYLNESGYVRDVENDIPDDDPTIVEEIYSAIDSKSDVGHTHDDRYYTETEMDNLLSAKVNTSDIKDNLTSEDTDKPLSAKQGKVLKDTVDLKVNTSDIQDDFTSTATDKPLAAVCGKQLYERKAEREHFHSKEDITDFSHNHDGRYYTESEVDEIVENLKHDLDNRITLDGDKSIIQTGDKVDFKVFLLKNGVPKADENVYFYVKEDE